MAMTTSGLLSLESDALNAAQAQFQVQVAFLTGQSDAPRCALSPVQRAFLDALPLPASAKLPLNFPYDAGTAPWRHVPLIAASVSNARLYMASRRPDFAARHAPDVLRVLARAPRTLILAGSAGLEILVNLRLPREALERVHVLAYGPVARRLPDCACVLVQGRRDWVSRWWFPAVDHRVECTHLDYLESPEVMALCVQTLRRMTERELTPSTLTDRELTTRGAS
jgi:hypothetical protein